MTGDELKAWQGSEGVVKGARVFLSVPLAQRGLPYCNPNLEFAQELCKELICQRPRGSF